jgi:DNA-binding transcriptional LysR family regulator
VALPENEQLKEKTINKEDLYNYPLIMTEKRIIERNFDTSKFKDVLDYKTEDYSLALDMVKEGVGITLIPNVARDKRIKGVKYVKLQPEIKRIIGLYYKKPMLRRKEIKTLIEYLKNYK